MTETAARVTRVQGDAAWVAGVASASCGACGGRGCGSSLFGRLWHPQEPEFQVANPIGARPGDRVVVGLPEGALWRAALASYLVPLGLLLAGAVGGRELGGEPGAVAGGLGGLALAAVWLVQRRGRHPAPVILRRDDGGGHCDARPRVGEP